MSIGQSMLTEFDHEMANTRKMLERIPEDKLSWKPDPKSMSMGELASHLAEMIGWTKETITEPSIDITPDFKPFKATSKAELLKKFEDCSAAARAALASAEDSGMMAPWKLSMNGQTIFEMPRVGVLRGMIMNHVIHHRGQLSVYFRLAGVPVPGMYGPSADEQQQQASAG